MKQNREMSRFSFIILIVIVWLSTSASMTVRAAGVPTVKRMNLDLRGGTRTYYWTQGDQLIHNNDAFSVKRDQALRLELENHTKTDFILNLHNYRFNYIKGGSPKSTMADEVYLTAGNRTIVEIPPNMGRNWRFSATKLYDLNYMHRSVPLPDPMTPRVPDSPRYNARVGVPMMPVTKAYERNPASVFPGTWYKDFLLYTNYFGVNSSIWSGRLGSDLMFEHDYDDQYRFQVDAAYNPYEDLDVYVGYERDKRDNRDNINHIHLGLHYTFPWLETDLTYDKDDHLTLRFRTEVPLTDDVSFFADYDTNKDYRFKLLYNLTRNFTLVANYHWRYHGGVGIDYTF